MSRVLIKLGGSSLSDAATIKETMQLIQWFKAQGDQVVLVHGGGPAINAALTEKGITWKFINGLRQTTPEMMDVIESVLFGKINRDLVEILSADSIEAYGYSGATHGLLICSRLDDELMQVGNIVKCDVDVLEDCFARHPLAVAVIAPLGVDANGQKYNINADWAACKLAAALKVDRLIFLTDQAGILDADKNVLAELNEVEIESLIASGVISGGMMTKVRTMIDALKSGIREVRVLKAAEGSRMLIDPQVGSRIKLDHLTSEGVELWNHLTI